MFAAPDDGVGGVGPEPEEEGEEVAEGEEREVAEDLAVAEEANTDDEGDGDAGEDGEREEGEAPEGAATCYYRQQCPGEDVGDAEAEVAGAEIGRASCRERV